MAVSNNTAGQLYASLRRHLTPAQIQAIVNDLAVIPGNSSFRATVEKIVDLHVVAKNMSSKFASECAKVQPKTS
jgi:hypothetical protein